MSPSKLQTSESDRKPKFGRRTGACDNCQGPFRIPNNVKNGKKKKRFCCDNCRKEFWKNKGVSVFKLKEQAYAWVTEAVRPLSEAVQQLGNRVALLEERRNGHR